MKQFIFNEFSKNLIFESYDKLHEKVAKVLESDLVSLIVIFLYYSDSK